MEDVLVSSDSMSSASGEEFEIVAAAAAAGGEGGGGGAETKASRATPTASTALATSPPTLNIAHGDIADLEQNLKDVIREIERSDSSSADKRFFESDPEDAGLSRDELRQKYGRSVFYDCLDASPTTTTDATTPTEKQDDMKPDPENNNTEDDSEWNFFFFFFM